MFEVDLPDRNIKSSDYEQYVNGISAKLIEFWRVFDTWHCGLNQLKTFKGLSFKVAQSGLKTDKV